MPSWPEDTRQKVVGSNPGTSKGFSQEIPVKFALVQLISYEMGTFYKCELYNV